MSTHTMSLTEDDDDVAVLKAEPWHVRVNALAFGASVAAQVTGIVLALVALGNNTGSLPSALLYLIWLDLIVQVRVSWRALLHHTHTGTSPP